MANRIAKPEGNKPPQDGDGDALKLDNDATVLLVGISGRQDVGRTGWHTVCHDCPEAEALIVEDTVTGDSAIDAEHLVIGHAQAMGHDVTAQEVRVR